MKRLAAALFLCTSSAWAQSPCDGRITDQLPHPLDPAAVSKPAQGECYVDPVFGTKICRVGNADPAEGLAAVVKTTYNSTWGWNADESLILLWHRGGRIYEIFEGGEPYSHVMTMEFVGSATGGVPTDIEHILWDVTDPNVLYYPNNYRYAGSDAPLLYKVTIDRDARTFSQEIYHNFTSAPTNCPPEYALSLGHSHDMSLDGKKMIGLSCGYGETRQIMLYSIVEDTVYGTRASPAPDSSYAPLPFLDGTGAYFEATQEVMDVNLNTTLTLNMYARFEHQVMGLAAGANVLDRVNFDAPPAVGSLVSISMATGADTVIVGQANGWPYPPSSTHPSLTPRDGSSWVAISSTGSLPLGQSLLHNELYLGNVATGEVCRIAHTRTYAKTGSWGYWGEAHPQLSNDGYRVLFTSDWLDSDTIDAYVVDLRPQDLTILTPSLPNAVVGESYSIPISIAGGTPPYSCSIIGTPPAGIHLDGCTVTGPSTAVETRTFSIEACDTVSDCVQKQYTLESQERPEIMSVSPIPSGLVGKNYSFQFQGQKGVAPLNWEALNASACKCDGLSMSSTGAWVGIPESMGLCTFDVKVTDSHAPNPLSVTGPFQMTVNVEQCESCVWEAILFEDQADNEDGFRVERSESGPGGPFTPVKTLPPNPDQATQPFVIWTDAPVDGGQEYCYRVIATLAPDGDSPPSNVLCATTPSP